MTTEKNAFGVFFCDENGHYSEMVAMGNTG